MKKILLLLTIMILAMALAACGGEATPTPAPTAVPEQPTAVPPTAEPTEAPTAVPEPPAAYTEIVWQWVDVVSQADGTTTVPNPENYTLIFHEDGTFNGMADCNAFAGTYTTDTGFSLMLGPSTLAFCGEASLDAQYLALLSNVVAGGPDGSGGFALETAGGAERMNFQNGGPAPAMTESVPAEVTGEIVYKERIALPDDATVTVQIQDISLADAPATVIGEQSYLTEGQQVPLPFVVAYDSAAIEENHSYGLSIRITAADETLLFTNDTVIPVITNGNPTSDIVANVIMVNSPAGEAEMVMIDENTIVLSPDLVSLDTQGLPYSYQPVYVPETPYDASMPPGPVGLPAHIEVLFGVTDPADRQPNDPIMYIIPVAAYEAMWEEAGSEAVTGMMDKIAQQTYLLPQPAPISGMPALPYEEVVGVNDLSVQVARAVTPAQQTDEMATKNGYRFVGRWGQSPNPVTNQNLRYVYQGFTNDGAYLVSFFFPVATDQLPNESADLSAEEMAAFDSDVTAAMTASADMLNTLPADAWQPDLATLDALVASLQITDFAVNGLVDKTFHWTGEVVNPSSGEVTVNELGESEFSLMFNADGTFSGVVDCNNTAGSVTITGGVIGSIAFQPGPTTAAFCGEASFDTVFQGLLAATQNYKVAPGGNQMELSMPAGGGDYLFEAVPPKTAVATPAPQPIERVVGRQLQWITFFDAVEGEQAIPNPELYQLLLNEDGTLNVTADCKATEGTYTVDGQSIEMMLGPVTMQICSEESLADQYLSHLSNVRIFFNQDGDVFFDLFADGGTMQFTDVESMDDTADATASEADNGTEAVSDATIEINLQGLADSYSWEVVPAVPAAPGPGGIGSSAYVMVTFNDATITETLDSNGPRIAIYPIEAYINVAGNSVAAQVDLLNSLLALPAGETPEPETAMPLLPPPGSFMNRWVQYLNLAFTQGDGVRYVSDSPYRQSFGVWANDTTGYYYQAMTKDGRYYISLFWPVSTEALPDTADEATEDAKAQATNPETNAAYQEAIRASLNELSASDWTPNLDDLDALAASIEFTP
ncbi:MAG: META domain-containing protein [Anaerolineae bacterium]|nr:META domain-containing protein [Anaerolineae bacterium]